MTIAIRWIGKFRSVSTSRERSPPLPIPPQAGSLQPPCQRRCSAFMRICSINHDYSDGTDHNDIYDWEDEEPNKHFINDDEGFDVAISDKGCHEKSYLEEQRNDDIGSQGAKSPMRRSCLVPGSDQNIKGVFFPTWQNCSANEKQFCIFLREKNSIRLWLLIVFHFGTVNWEEK